MGYDFVKWLGHASFLLKDKELNIYIDPFKLSGASERADIIFITHPHFDHFNEPELEKIVDEKTHFIAPAEVAAKLVGKNVTIATAGKKGEVMGIEFEAIPAYNIEPERLDFHPKSSGWVGYIIKVNGKRIYHPGDTDAIEEMRKIEVDLAFLPCGGKYVMDIEQAIKASKMIHAKHFAPMHYRALLGKDDSEKT